MKTFVVLDLETTGLNPYEGEITEVAAIKVNAETLEVVNTFTSLVKVSCKLDDFIINLTGITNELLDKEGREQEEVLKELNEFIGNDYVYAHYSVFDQSWTAVHMVKRNINLKASGWLDTKDIFDLYLDFENKPNNKLETFIKHYGLAESEDHRAMSDAMHTLNLMRMSAEKGWSHMVENLAFNPEDKFVKLVLIKNDNTEVPSGLFYTRSEAIKSGTRSISHPKSGMIGMKMEVVDRYVF